MTRFLLEHSFPRFCVVGGAGFLIDAALLQLSHYGFGVELLLSRCISLLTALTATWWMNRSFAFRLPASAGLFYEWARYLVTNGIGAAVNLGLFVWLVNAEFGALSAPMPAVVLSSACALTLNYFSMRYLVFTAANDDRDHP